MIFFLQYIYILFLHHYFFLHNFYIISFQNEIENAKQKICCFTLLYFPVIQKRLKKFQKKIFSKLFTKLLSNKVFFPKLLLICTSICSYYNVQWNNTRLYKYTVRNDCCKIQNWKTSQCLGSVSVWYNTIVCLSNSTSTSVTFDILHQVHLAS